MGPTLIAPVKAIIGLTGLSLTLAQVAPITPNATTVDMLGRLTLDGALGIAVVWLARTFLATIASHKVEITALMAAKDARIAEKDAQLVAMASKVTETMALVLEAVRELRTSVNEVKDEGRHRGRA